MSSVATVFCVHDDHWFLASAIRSFKAAGPVYAFVSRLAWDGSPGNWQPCAEIAEAEGATVILGDWADESTHRRYALSQTLFNGHRYALIPDGDEVIEPRLLDSLLKIAGSGLAERMNVMMDTYWKSPRYVIRPREQLTPAILLDLEQTRHIHIRHYEGGRQLTLDAEHGVLHHLSYAGPDERILRKIRTWGHKDEVLSNWNRQVWQGWDRDPLLRNLHPTHPQCYGWAERTELPEILEGAWDDRAAHEDPEVPKGWPKVSVVIPLHGGEEDIRICLDSLANCQDLLHETIVVDDVSPDGAAGVAEAYPFVKLMRNAENLGFAGTCNRGTEASTGDVVIYLNSDTAVPRAGLIRLVESLMESGSVGAAGPFTNNAGYEQPTFVTYTSLETMELFARDFAHRDAEDRDVPMLVGFCLAVRRSVLDELGLFDTRFGRGLFEDNDLVYRIQRAGYRCRLASRAFVHHKGSQSLGRMPESPSTLLARNMQVFHEKWRDDIESGYASHLPGQRAEPIVFNPDRSPEKRAKEMARLKQQADVSLVMIVRDEERVLGECLKSVEGVFNQVVVVDTGSNDRTCEIALEHGAELHEFPWTESFSEARNESLKHARGRWVFWMDADDTLPRQSAELLLRAAAMAPEDVVGFVVPVQFVEGGPGGTRVDHVKLFRNLPSLAFEGRIHEQILGSLRRTGGNIARLDGAVVLHSGYDTSEAGQAKKRLRDERLLKLDLEERPDHPFVLFNLGMTAHYTSGHPEAVEWLKRSIAAAEPTESHVRKAYALMGVSLREMGDLEGALQAFSAGLEAVGEDPELRFQSALVLTSLGRLEEARAQYLDMPTDVSGHFSSVDTGILGPKREHNLGAVCLAMERYPEARDHFRSAMSMGFAPSAHALFEAAMEREDLRVAAEAVEGIRELDGPGEAWATALANLAVARGEDPFGALWQALRERPNATGARLLIARRLLETGDEASALGHLEVLDASGVAEAAYFRGVCATRRGAYDEALTHMRRALHLNPGHEPTREQVAALEQAVGA